VRLEADDSVRLEEPHYARVRPAGVVPGRGGGSSPCRRAWPGLLGGL
jgi:hypothetical protein